MVINVILTQMFLRNISYDPFALCWALVSSVFSRIPTLFSALLWSLMHCCVVQFLRCPVKSRVDWEALAEVLLLSTSPLSCFLLMKLWGTSAPSNPWWMGIWWPDMEANSWRSKLLNGEVNWLILLLLLSTKYFTFCLTFSFTTAFIIWIVNC